MKKIKYLFFLVLCVVMMPKNAFANVTDNTPINVHIFKSSSCSHCADAMEFFTELSKDTEYSKYFKLVTYETYSDSALTKEQIAENADLAEKVCDYFGVKFNGVPLIVIGDKKIEGYIATMNDEIKSAIKSAYNKEPVIDIVMDVKNGTIKKSPFDTIMAVGIVGVLVLGIGYFIYIARKTTPEEESVMETKETTKVLEPIVEEEKKTTKVFEPIAEEEKENAKPVVKKATTKTASKKTTSKKTASKKTTTVKSSATKTASKTQAKKTTSNTAKKAQPKKTTKK